MRILYHPKRILGFETYVAPEGFDRKAQPVDIYDVFERYYKNHKTAKFIIRVLDSFANQWSLGTDEVPLSAIMDGLMTTSFVYAYKLNGIKYRITPPPRITHTMGVLNGNYDTITVNSTSGYPETGKISVGSYNAVVYQTGTAYGNIFTYTSKDETHFYGVSQYIKTMYLHSIVDPVITFYGTERYIICNDTRTTTINANVQLLRCIDWLYCGNLIGSINTSNGATATWSSIKYIHLDKLSNITSYPDGCHRNGTLTGTLHLAPLVDIGTGRTTFAGQTLLSGTLVIPDTVVNLGVGGNCFGGCAGLTELKLGSSVEVIGNNCFINCTGLDGTLTIPNSCTVIEYNAFYNCNKLDTLDLGTGVQTIGNSAFQACAQLSGTLVLPDSLTTIGTLAFYGCTSFSGTLTIPLNVTSIGQGAFGDDNFSDIDVTANSRYEDVDDVLYEISTRTALHSVKSDTGTITFQSNTLIIGDYCCLRNQRTGTLTIPDSVTRVGIYAFYDCDGFTALVLETSSSALATIDDYAFSHCSNLAGTLTLPNSVTLVDAGAFRDDVLITGIVFSSALVTIGADAFRQMTAISENLVIPNSVETIGATAFFNNTARTGTLTLGTGLKTIGGQAFAFNPLTGTLTIPSAVTAIGEGAFCNNNFSAVASSASGFTVSDYVLYDETVSGQIKAHTSVRGYTGTLTLKAGTTSVLLYCFYDNDSRSGAIVIPYTVTAIGQEAFRGCGGFNAAVTIGDGTNGSALTTIGSLAFYDVDNVTRYDFYRTPAPLCNTSGSFGASPAKELHITSGATGYNVTPATNAAPWTNTAIFSSVTADL